MIGRISRDELTEKVTNAPIDLHFTPHMNTLLVMLHDSAHGTDGGPPAGVDASGSAGVFVSTNTTAAENSLCGLKLWVHR